MLRVILLLITAGVAGADEQRFAERTPPPHIPKQHNAETSGLFLRVRRLLPSVTPHNVLGYTDQTTFGMDYTLFSRRPWTVTPGLWPTGRKVTSFASLYASEPRHVLDVFALQPFRRAVKEAKAEKAEKAEKEEHGATASTPH